MLAVAMMLGVKQAADSWGWAAAALVVAVWLMVSAEKRDVREARARARHKASLQSDISTRILDGKKLQQLLMNRDAELEQTPSELYQDWVGELVCYFRSNLPHSEVVALSLEVPAWLNVQVAAAPDRAQIVRTLAHRLERLNDLHARIPSLELEPPERAR